MDEKDTASRKWQLTFNNPEEHGWTHDKIREVLRSFKTMAYWCMADEIGDEEKTPHTHLFINLSPSNCRFSTLKNKFPGAHIEKVLGTSQDNRDYISNAKYLFGNKTDTSNPTLDQTAPNRKASTISRKSSLLVSTEMVLYLDFSR